MDVLGEHSNVTVEVFFKARERPCSPSWEQGRFFDGGALASSPTTRGSRAGWRRSLHAVRTGVAVKSRWCVESRGPRRTGR
jgi:hypothetical protein